MLVKMVTTYTHPLRCKTLERHDPGNLIKASIHIRNCLLRVAYGPLAVWSGERACSASSMKSQPRAR